MHWSKPEGNWLTSEQLVAGLSHSCGTISSLNLFMTPSQCGHILVCYAKSLQSCPTLCDLIDGSPPGSPFPGILQARTLEWVAISFSNA